MVERHVEVKIAMPEIREYIEMVEGQSYLPKLAMCVGSSAKKS